VRKNFMASPYRWVAFHTNTLKNKDLNSMARRSRPGHQSAFFFSWRPNGWSFLQYSDFISRSQGIIAQEAENASQKIFTFSLHPIDFGKIFPYLVFIIYHLAFIIRGEPPCAPQP